MAGLTKTFFDTSVLVAGTIDFGPSSEPALQLLDAVADGRIDEPLTAWHCCLELYSVTTRLPEEYRLSPEVALRVLDEEILPRFEIHDLPVAARDAFFSAAVAEGAVGGRIYDVHIAEIARRAGAELVVTDNRRHFTSLLRHGIRVLVGSEAADELIAEPEGNGSDEELGPGS